MSSDSDFLAVERWRSGRTQVPQLMDSSWQEEAAFSAALSLACDGDEQGLRALAGLQQRIALLSSKPGLQKAPARRIVKPLPRRRVAPAKSALLLAAAALILVVVTGLIVSQMSRSAQQVDKVIAAEGQNVADEASPHPLNAPDNIVSEPLDVSLAPVVVAVDQIGGSWQAGTLVRSPQHLVLKLNNGDELSLAAHASLRLPCMPRGLYASKPGN